MKIDSVDLFYLSMPEILDIGDGSQDALLVRIRAGGLEGWGECEASPLPSIASYFCPMSHSACKPLKYSLEGKNINDVKDILRISEEVHENSQDLLQADHTLSGIDIALWDLLGKMLQEPVYKLLGYPKAYPKLPYASLLFGDTPEETFEKARNAKMAGYNAVKFGWGPFGREGVSNDTAQLLSAREGLGPSACLMVDAGTVWRENVSAAKERLAVLHKIKAYWLEEPFTNMALGSYKCLSEASPNVAIAGGEGCNNYTQASAMIQFAGLKYIQIDTGRVGGITAAKKIADLAQSSGLTYVNHTFTSHLALSASLQPFAGIENDFLCEYPVELKPLAKEVTRSVMAPGPDGYIRVSDQIGLGIEVDVQSLRKYLVEVEITINGTSVYYTPEM